MNKWFDYEEVSPKKSGKYLIFIDGNQHICEYHVNFGFASSEDGCAFQQHLITHWAELGNNP